MDCGSAIDERVERALREVRDRLDARALALEPSILLMDE